MIAEIYMELGEYEKAVEALKQGVQNTEDEDLQALLKRAERMASIDFEHLVTDAFRETLIDRDASMEPSEWAIPKILLDDPAVAEINREVWEELYEKAAQPNIESSAEGYPTGRGISYQWAVSGDILSVWIESHPYPYAWTDYYIYNVSIMTGKRLSDEEVYSTVDYTTSEYQERVKQAASSRFQEGAGSITDWSGDPMEDIYKAQLKNTVSEENVQDAKPFFNQQGHLCVAIPIYSMAGADFYWQTLDLEDFAPGINYNQILESVPPKKGITEEEAYELVKNYWNFVPGTVAEETGNELFLSSFGSITGSNGRTYYEIRFQWLVDGDTEWAHLSTIDVMYVDAETGELVGDMLP